MTEWDDFTDELDRWRVAGRVASFWWRDDDAVAPSPSLERLLELAGRYRAGLALAVIPKTCEEALASELAAQAEAARVAIAVFQHGIAHQNRAAAGEKKTELTAAVPPDETRKALQAGRERLYGLFGQRFLPVLVPPWNRIAPDLIPGLPASGFTGLSTYKVRSQRQPVPGLLQVNTHADLLRWGPERGFRGESEVLALLTEHLQTRRNAFLSEDKNVGLSEEPTGLLTHHLVHDEATWRFLDELLATLRRHPATKLLAPSEAFFHAEPKDGTTEPAGNRTEGAPDIMRPGANGVQPQQPTRKGRA